MQNATLIEKKEFYLEELKKVGIQNNRITKIILKCDCIETAKKKHSIYLKKAYKFINLMHDANILQLDINIDEKKELENIDIFDINILYHKVKQEKNFRTFKKLCIKNLSKTVFPKSTLNKIKDVNSQFELNNILKEISYEILIKNGLAGPSNHDPFNKDSSVRVKYTNMKNQ